MKKTKYKTLFCFSEHHIIHVPYHVHHVHHVHKYPVYIKSKPIIIKDHSYHSDWAPSSSGWNSGWDWDKCKSLLLYFFPITFNIILSKKKIYNDISKC